MNKRAEYLSAMNDYQRRQRQVMEDVDLDTGDYNATAHHVVRTAGEYIEYLEGRVHTMTLRAS